MTCEDFRVSDFVVALAVYRNRSFAQNGRPTEFLPVTVCRTVASLRRNQNAFAQFLKGITKPNLKDYLNNLSDVIGVVESRNLRKNFRKKKFVFLDRKANIDAEALASTSAGSPADGRPASGVRAPISVGGGGREAEPVRKLESESEPAELPEHLEKLGKGSKCYARVAQYKNRIGLGSGKLAARRVDRGRAKKKGPADLPKRPQI